MVYDSVIIGGGHNGLVCAAYLAKAGKKVLVLEARSILGGCASTEELWPGFKVSRAAYVVSLLQSDIIKDLNLAEKGFKVLPRNPSSITPDLKTGKALILGPDINKNRESIEQFNKSDARKYAKYEEYLTDLATELEPFLTEIQPVLKGNGRNLGVVGKIKEAYKAFKLYRRFSAMPDPQAVLEIMTVPATTILNRYFTSEILKSSLATDAIIGAFLSPSSPGSAYVLLHHVMGDAGGARGVWGYVQGGMGGLADALEKTCIELGVQIIKDVIVDEITIDSSTATRITAHTSEFSNGFHSTHPVFYHAKTVASSIDINKTFSMIRSRGECPVFPGYSNKINQIDYTSGSGKINIALDRLPKFIGVPDDVPLSGTIHISPTMEYIEKAYFDALTGKVSEQPILEITIPSVVDSTIAPEGKHIMSVFVQYLPYGTGSEHRERTLNNCIDLIEQYAPGFKESILHSEILFPEDLEKIYGLTGGNIMQGSMGLNQLGPFRPIIGWSDHKTPVENLYLCGAAASPGGGVMGICGKNAAKVILDEI